METSCPEIAHEDEVRSIPGTLFVLTILLKLVCLLPSNRSIINLMAGKCPWVDPFVNYMELTGLKPTMTQMRTEACAERVAAAPNINNWEIVY
ncbi:uncharacterized protein ACBT57_011532 [Dama dama]